MEFYKSCWIRRFLIRWEKQGYLYWELISPTKHKHMVLSSKNGIKCRTWSTLITWLSAIITIHRQRANLGRCTGWALNRYNRAKNEGTLISARNVSFPFFSFIRVGVMTQKQDKKINVKRKKYLNAFLTLCNVMRSEFLPVIKAQVGETWHETLKGLFKFSNLSGKLPSFLQQTFFLPVCRRT